MTPKRKLKNVTPYVPNPYAPEISDEYYINEIIGIDEIRYKDFIKKPEPKNNDNDVKYRNNITTGAQKNFINMMRGDKE